MCILSFFIFWPFRARVFLCGRLDTQCYFLNRTYDKYSNSFLSAPWLSKNGLGNQGSREQKWPNVWPKCCGCEEQFSLIFFSAKKVVYLERIDKCSPQKASTTNFFARTVNEINGAGTITSNMLKGRKISRKTSRTRASSFIAPTGSFPAFINLLRNNFTRR